MKKRPQPPVPAGFARCGASCCRNFGSALAAAWIVVFVLSFGELGASVLIAPPGESTLPIRIYTIIANTPPAQVAALALLQAVVVLTPLVVLASGHIASRSFWARSKRA